MSLTDEIYRELLDGLEKNLDWEQFLAKYSASKGPLYNAIARFFTEVKPKIVALNEERSRVQSSLDQAGLTLDSWNRKITEAEGNFASLEERNNTLNEQVEILDTKLAEKSELVQHLSELESLSFDSERLRQLHETLTEIGAKHGLKGKEAVRKFFEDLKDYETILGADLQLEGLQTQIETKKLEAENWQAKEEALKRKHDDLKEALGAVRTLRSRGIKVSQIITWHKILNRFQTVEQFDQSLAQYGNITNLLNTRKEETKSYELKLAKAQSQVETLEKETAKLEGVIDALKATWVKQLETMTEEATKQFKVVAAIEKREIQVVGQEARSEFSNFFAQLDASSQKVFELGQEFERTNEKLQKYEGVKDALKSHVIEPEAGK